MINDTVQWKVTLVKNEFRENERSGLSINDLDRDKAAHSLLLTL